MPAESTSSIEGQREEEKIKFVSRFLPPCEIRRTFFAPLVLTSPIASCALVRKCRIDALHQAVAIRVGSIGKLFSDVIDDSGRSAAACVHADENRALLKAPPPGAKKPRPKGRGKVTFGSVKRISGITRDATARPYHRAGSTEPGMIFASRNPASRFLRDFFPSGRGARWRIVCTGIQARSLQCKGEIGPAGYHDCLERLDVNSGLRAARLSRKSSIRSADPADARRRSKAALKRSLATS